jgi:glycosyltransferase involved in cell wall biosynthesis
MKEPMVTVLMPVYNGEKHLREALESILNQTYTDFEFLIIDDGSTDRSVEIVDSYNDPRIRLVKNGTNLKLITTLNWGLNIARGKYIARMDCDDISLPERLAKQVDFLEENPQIGLCGTWAKTIGVHEGTIYRYPTDPEVLKCRLLFHCSLLHPSIMMRKDIVILNQLQYSKEYLHAEDYGFFVAMSRITKLANLPEVLLLYRFSATQVSSKYFQEQKETNFKIQVEQLVDMGMKLSAEELRLHRIITSELDPSLKKEAYEWLAKILKANNGRKLYLQSALVLTIRQYWEKLRSYFDMYDRYLNLCQELSKENQTFAIWGCGDFAEALAKSTVLAPNIRYVIDGNPVNCGKLFKKLDMIIESPTALVKNPVDVVIAASWQRSNEIAYDIRYKYNISSKIICADGVLMND